MSDSPLIAQPGKQKMTLLRESYLAICDGDACAARLLNAMERWHFYKLQTREELRGRNRARRQGGLAATNDEDLWVRMAVDPKDGKSLGWRGELMDEYSYKVVARGLDLLVAKGFALKRENPRLNWDRTPQWLFQVEAVQAAVNAWAVTREDPGMSADVDGAADPETGEITAVDDSAELTDSTRQICRMDSADLPNQLGESAETSRQKDRSNNTDIPTQESSPGILKQTSSSGSAAAPAPVPVQDDDDRSADAGKTGDPEIPTTPEGGEDSPLSGNDRVQVEDTKLDQATAPEHVPGAAAGGGWAILAPQPIPRAELEARPARDPESMKVLRALMQASKSSRLAHLHEQLDQDTSVMGIPRHLLTRLTDEELRRAREAAQHDAPRVKNGMLNAGYHALDRLIGETFTEQRLIGGRSSEAAVTVTPNGNSLKTVEEQRREAGERPPVTENSIWYGKRSGRAFRVIQVLDGEITVEGVQGEYNLDRFHANFTPEPAAQASA